MLRLNTWLVAAISFCLPCLGFGSEGGYWEQSGELRTAVTVTLPKSLGPVAILHVGQLHQQLETMEDEESVLLSGSFNGQQYYDHYLRQSLWLEGLGELQEGDQQNTEIGGWYQPLEDLVGEHLDTTLMQLADSLSKRLARARAAEMSARELVSALALTLNGRVEWDIDRQCEGMQHARVHFATLETCRPLDEQVHDGLLEPFGEELHELIHHLMEATAAGMEVMENYEGSFEAHWDAERPEIFDVLIKVDGSMNWEAEDGQVDVQLQLHQMLHSEPMPV